MSDGIYCPNCGGKLPAGQPKGLCAHCATKGALDLEATVQRRPRKPVILTLAAIVVLMALVGLVGLVIAKRNGLVAAESDKSGREHQPPNFQRATQVSVEFGATNRESGLSVVEVGDSRHTVKTIDGQPVGFSVGAGITLTSPSIPTSSGTLGLMLWSELSIRFLVVIRSASSMTATAGRIRRRSMFNVTTRKRTVTGGSLSSARGMLDCKTPKTGVRTFAFTTTRRAFS